MKQFKFGARMVSLFIVTIITANLFAAPVSAYVDSGYRLEGRLTFTPHNSIGATSLSHFNEAFWAWNSRSSVYNLQRTVTTHDLTDYYTNSKTDNRIYKVRNTSANAPAEVRMRISADNRVLSAAFNLNTAFTLTNGNTGGYDVWTIFIHEAGHVLGFGHSSLDSVMNVYPSGTIKRSLTVNDTIGITGKYG